MLPTMVSLLSSWLSALVGCFRCPPPPTLAAFPWQSLSAVRCPHSRRFDVAVAVSSPCRSDTAGGPPPLRRNLQLGPTILRLLGEGQRAIAVVAAANVHLRVVVVVIAVVAPAIPLPSPQLRATSALVAASAKTSPPHPSSPPPVARAPPHPRALPHAPSTTC